MRFWWARRRVHASYVVICLAAGVILGVAASFLWKITIFNAVIWLVMAGLVVVFALVYRRVFVMVLVVVAGFVVGCFRTGALRADVEYISGVVGKNVAVVGRVFEDPDIKGDGTMSLRMNKLVFGENRPAGNLYVSVASDVDIKRGDDVKVYGKLAEGFGSFAGSMYRAKVDEVVRSEPGDLARVVRDWFADEVREFVPEPEVNLGLGYLLGQRRALSAALVEILKLTGLTHIVVASGYNLTVLVRFMRRLFRKVSRFAALFFAAMLVIGFITVTGASPSMVRAGLVSGLSLIAWYYGRKFHPVKLLLLVAAVTLMLSPSYIVDLGWQLSFGSFAGVMLLAPLITAYFYGKEKVGTIKQILIETVSAQICTAPILIYFFGQISVVSIFANILVLPTIPFAMMLTFLTGMFALVVPLLAEFVGFLTTWVLKYNLAVMEFFGKVPWAMRDVNIGIVGVVILYGVIFGAGFYMQRVTGYSLAEADIIQ